MRQLKFGVLGVRRGTTFIELLQIMGERACLTAICDTNAENVEKISDKIPQNVVVYSDYDEFLDSGIDAVILCNFFHEHAAFAIKALNKGVHVLSETTAAATMGECVALCRAAEQSEAKYMLGANVPYGRGIQLMKKMFEEGRLGEVCYAEAEYLHYSGGSGPSRYANTRHWRRLLPGTYYNMHTLGPLMYITGTVPKKVTARVAKCQKMVEAKQSLKDHVGAITLCEMDNGALFDVTGCSNYGPTSKWFRINGEKGVIETERYDETKVLFASSLGKFTPDDERSEIERYEPKYEELNMISEEEFSEFTEEQFKIGHSGMDFWLLLYFIKYLNGEYEPFFNVYRSVALSAAGILGWRSIINQCTEYEIPDFTKEEERKAYENDFLSPFAEEDSENLIPCRSE